MIFKTIDNNNDKLSSKISIFGKSFEDIGNRFNKLSNQLMITNNYTISNIANAWKNSSIKKDLSDKFIITKKDIAPKLKDITAYDNFDESQANSILIKLQEVNQQVLAGRATWDDYYKSLEKHPEMKWQENFIKNTNLQTASTQDVIKAQKAARESAIEYNHNLNQMTIESKAAAFGMKALSVLNKRIIYLTRISQN